jgi:hypothetical protein
MARWTLSNPQTQSHDPWADFLTHGLLGTEILIKNARVEISAMRVGMHTVPLVTNHLGRSDCSWVTSLRNAYGPYARAETDIVRMNRFFKPLYLAASYAAEGLLTAGGLSGGNYLNNWLLATNLYLPDLAADDILTSLDDACLTKSNLPIVIRSLTPPFHADLIARLSQAGFLLFPSRQVWIVHNPASGAWRKHRDSRRDLALAQASEKRWTWVPGSKFTDNDFARGLYLYQRLYRERYPKFNPDITEQFLRIGQATGFLDLAGLRASDSSVLSGVIAMVHRADVTCTPLLGYDIDQPLSTGLYRLLMLRAFLECETRRTTLHCSAGAGKFKAGRGATSHVEFAAVWANHLPLYRRAHLRSLSAAVSKWIVPYLESYQC